jgi:hypothetical protein
MSSEQMSYIRRYINGALAIQQKDLYNYTQEKTKDRYSQGRALWSRWTKKHLLNYCKLNNLIDKELRMESLHPISLLRGSDRKKPFQIPLRFQQRFLDSLAATVFGTEVFCEVLNGDDGYPAFLDGFLEGLKCHIMDRLRKDRDSVLRRLEKDRDLCKEEMDGRNSFSMLIPGLPSSFYFYPGIYESVVKKERVTVHALNSAISKIQQFNDGVTYNGDPELSLSSQTYLMELRSILESVGARGLPNKATPTSMQYSRP